MNPRRVIFLLYLAFAVVAFSAETKEPLLEFSRVDLKDGRKLKNVVVKSYDPKSEKVLLIAGGTAMTVPIALFPPPFDEQLKSARAPAAVNVISTPVPTTPGTPTPGNQGPITFVLPPAIRPGAPQSGNYRPPQQIVVSPTPVYQPQIQAAAPPVDDGPAHRAVALTRAQNYYRFEHQMGSNNIQVTGLRFETEEPRAIPGWEGRYETKGQAFIEYYDSFGGGSFQRTTQRFEVTTERKAGDREIKVVGFDRRS